MKAGAAAMVKTDFAQFSVKEFPGHKRKVRRRVMPCRQLLCGAVRARNASRWTGGWMDARRRVARSASRRFLARALVRLRAATMLLLLLPLLLCAVRCGVVDDGRKWGHADVG